jgi:hypothetical protein
VNQKETGLELVETTEENIQCCCENVWKNDNETQIVAAKLP